MRLEHFGGLAFDTRSGMIVELDYEAMALLVHISNKGSVAEDEINERFPEYASASVLQDLLSLGIVTTGASVGKRTYTQLSSKLPKREHLSAPETVHWAITYRCDQDCPDCYARPHRYADHSELDTPSALELVDRLSEWGVLQLAIGGGEPLCRPDLAGICRHAQDSGLVVHVTTGYHQLPDNVVSDLAGAVNVIQIGIKHHRLLGDPEGETARLCDSVRRVQSADIHIGANLMLSNTVIEHFGEILGYLADAGFHTITLLRYKPVDDTDRWLSENPQSQVWAGFQNLLCETRALYPGLQFRADCALSFLQRSLDPNVAEARGIRGCVAGNRILALTPETNAYPCSQLIRPELFAGNLLSDEVDDVWSCSESLSQCRAFRDCASFRTSRCGICAASAFCGGCRAYASNLFGDDPGCPECV